MEMSGLNLKTRKRLFNGELVKTTFPEKRISWEEFKLNLKPLQKDLKKLKF